MWGVANSAYSMKVLLLAVPACGWHGVARNGGLMRTGARKGGATGGLDAACEMRFNG